MTKLFMKDQEFSQQYVISKRFNNIARNSIYIYWLNMSNDNDMCYLKANSLIFSHDNKVLDQNYRDSQDTVKFI